MATLDTTTNTTTSTTTNTTTTTTTTATTTSSTLAAAATSTTTSTNNSTNNSTTLPPPINEENQIKLDYGDLNLVQLIGQGSFSEVYLGTVKERVKNNPLKPYGTQFAFKTIVRRSLQVNRQSRQLIAAVLREKKALYQCVDITFVVKILGTAKSDDFVCFIMEYCPNGDLLMALTNYGAFTIEATRYYSACVIHAMDYMHQRGIVHRDLKPENILLTQDQMPRISDFGCVKLIPCKQPLSQSQSQSQLPSQSQLLQEIKEKEKDNNSNNSNNNNNNNSSSTNNSNSSTTTTTNNKNSKSDDPDFVGTPEFMAPELFVAHNFGGIRDENYKCLDFWSIGCLIYQLMTKIVLFKAATEYLVFQKVAQWDYQIPSDIKDETTIDLLQKLLKKNPQERLGVTNIKELQQHPFFIGIDWDKLSTMTPPPLNDVYLQKQKKVDPK